MVAVGRTSPVQGEAVLIRRAGWAALGRGRPIGGAPVSGAGPGPRPHHGNGPVQLVGDMLGALHRVGMVSLGGAGWCPLPLLFVGPWTGHPPALSLASTHVEWSSGVPVCPEDSAWRVAGAGRGGSGALVLTMSEARGSGRLAPGEILATGDILCSSFSVGGNVLDRPGWEMAQPLPRGLLAWDARPPPPASQHLLPVDWHPGGGPRPPRGLLAASRCWPSRGPGRRAVGVRRGPRSSPCTGAWVCLPRGGEREGSAPRHNQKGQGVLLGAKPPLQEDPGDPERGPLTPPEMCLQVQSPEWQSGWRAGDHPCFSGVHWAPVHLQGTCVVALRSGVGSVVVAMGHPPQHWAGPPQGPVPPCSAPGAPWVRGGCLL